MCISSIFSFDQRSPETYQQKFLVSPVPVDDSSNSILYAINETPDMNALLQNVLSKDNFKKGEIGKLY